MCNYEIQSANEMQHEMRVEVLRLIRKEGFLDYTNNKQLKCSIELTSRLVLRVTSILVSIKWGTILLQNCDKFSIPIYIAQH